MVHAQHYPQDTCPGHTPAPLLATQQDRKAITTSVTEQHLTVYDTREDVSEAPGGRETTTRSRARAVGLRRALGEPWKRCPLPVPR